MEQQSWEGDRTYFILCQDATLSTGIYSWEKIYWLRFFDTLCHWRESQNPSCY